MSRTATFQSQKRRIILVLLIVLIAVQVSIYLISVNANRNIAKDNLRSELQTADQMVDQLLELRYRQLAQGANVLAADYGLKEAIATGDRATIESMLRNHGQRLQADIALLNSHDRQLIASVPAELQPSDITAIIKASPPAGDSENPLPIKLLRSHNGMLYQLIHSVVKMPMPHVELTLGFAVNDALAADLKRVTNTEFVFLSRGENGAWQLHASTLDTSFAQLLGNPQALEAGSTWLLQQGDEEYLMHSALLPNTQLQGTGEVLVITGKSLQQALAAYARIESIQRFLLFASLLLSALAITVVSHRLLRPLNSLAHQDALTGLPNRRVFDQNVNRYLQPRGRRPVKMALMMIDLDYFKQINDQYGHAAGDEVLKVTAQRLQGLLRDADTPARLGGDEFAVLLPDVDRAGAIRLAAHIERVLSQPIRFGHDDLQVGVSIGIAVAPQDGSSSSELLRMADAEMYADKAQRDKPPV